MWLTGVRLWRRQRPPWRTKPRDLRHTGAWASPHAAEGFATAGVPVATQVPGCVRHVVPLRQGGAIPSPQRNGPFATEARRGEPHVPLLRHPGTPGRHARAWGSPQTRSNASMTTCRPTRSRASSFPVAVLLARATPSGRPPPGSAGSSRRNAERPLAAASRWAPRRRGTARGRACTPTSAGRSWRSVSVAVHPPRSCQAASGPRGAAGPGSRRRGCGPRRTGRSGRERGSRFERRVARQDALAGEHTVQRGGGAEDGVALRHQRLSAG